MLKVLKKILWEPWDLVVNRFARHYQDLFVEVYSNAAAKLNRDIVSKLQSRALDATANYVSVNMRKAIAFDSEPDLREYALKEAVDGGLFLEFGVWTGASINFFAERRKDKKFHGFDSFQGLPEDWEGNSKKGRFDTKGKLPKVRKNVELHVGLFDKILPNFLKQYKDPISFMHVDCDLYSSAKSIFDLLGDRICSSTVVVFDEYFNYPHWEHHEFKAFQEFILRTKLSYEYMGYHQFGREVIVKIK